MKLALLLGLCTLAVGQTRVDRAKLPASRYYREIHAGATLGPWPKGTRVRPLQVSGIQHFITAGELRATATVQSIAEEVPDNYRLLCVWDTLRIDFPDGGTIEEVIASLSEGDTLPLWSRYFHWTRVCAIPGTEATWLEDPFISEWYARQ